MDTPRTIPLHPSLLRPILIAGADRKLAILNFILSAAVASAFHWLSITVGLFLATFGHLLLVQFTKYDPQFRDNSVCVWDSC